eukprot:2129584-Rhodomonas_salina.1
MNATLLQSRWCTTIGEKNMVDSMRTIASVSDSAQCFLTASIISDTLSCQKLIFVIAIAVVTTHAIASNSRNLWFSFAFSAYDALCLRLSSSRRSPTMLSLPRDVLVACLFTGCVMAMWPCLAPRDSMALKLLPSSFGLLWSGGGCAAKAVDC